MTPTCFETEVDIGVDLELLVLLVLPVEILIELEIKVKGGVSVVEDQSDPGVPPVIIRQLHRKA